MRGQNQSVYGTPRTVRADHFIFSAIAKTSDDQIGELPVLIERLQSSNDTFKTKTQQIALELEQMKMKSEKQAR